VKLDEFMFMILAVAIGGFLALIAWTLIVKSQVSSSLAGNSTVNLIASLLGSTPAAAPAATPASS
jgi:hypothetical protein